mmetsp:Transcript_35326/g.72157  ORF Transcript_35326/g.72157 Transcript_35326/m.72157 type:complete len:139 (+) Transcript_35326:170-586(+)
MKETTRGLLNITQRQLSWGMLHRIIYYQLYRGGLCGEKDEKKEVYHLERAAIGGHPGARHNLGCKEAENGNYERATRHLIIAASLGHEPSIEMLKANYTKGNVSKADFAAALRAHQAAIDATKSPQREAAEKWEKQQK